MNEKQPRPNGARRSRAWALCATAASAVLAFAAWSAAEVFMPPTSPTPTAGYLYARAQLGSVEESVPLRINAVWEPAGMENNQSAGTVTSIDIESGVLVASGDVLYSVDLRPVFAAVGGTPSFRALALGIKGQDVVQLQNHLRESGHFHALADGDFGTVTQDAVRRWQRSNGQPDDGMVLPGDVLYFDQLPAHVTLATEAPRVGEKVSGGEPMMQALSPRPSFSAPTTASQSGMMPDDTVVTVESPVGEWIGRIASRTWEDDGSVRLHVEGNEDGSLCGDQCATLSTTSPSQLKARAITVPRAEGVLIPSVAIMSTASGDTAVVDRTGKRTRVSVLASSRGQSVVAGISTGLEVRIEPSR